MGKSPSNRLTRTRSPGHPHAGGEISRRRNVLSVNYGPSPRGWGNHGGAYPNLCLHRAIPTRVGKSRGGAGVRRGTPGHPHAGGEIYRRGVRHPATNGPSPRGWGNRAVCQIGNLVSRAIPTRVGKSASLAPCATISAGHPHAGGKIRRGRLAGWMHRGPSPRGWGNQANLQPNAKQPRAIPTRVGKSEQAIVGQFVWPGHPHAGGEIKLAATADPWTRGPSPRGWGNRPHRRKESRRGRAIPTRVGKSAMPGGTLPPTPGHPHAGGEIVQPSNLEGPAVGPSPRGWGNPGSGSSW